SYTGGTTVNAGTLALGGGAGFSNIGSSTGDVSVFGGVLDLGGNNLDAGTVTITAGSVINGTLNATSGITVSSGNYSANFTGSGNLTKITTGLAILTGSNTYTGVSLINAGTLQI